MTSLAEVLALPNGARFHRADLHVHSYGASHDVYDPTMTPQDIIRTAVDERLDVIAVADHNEIKNVEPTLRAGEGAPLLVIPAIELSTPEGHLLCLLPSLESLERFFGRLSVVDRNSPKSRCQNSILDCLNRLGESSGCGILAHIDDAGGFETETPGASPHKLDVLSHEALLAIELKVATSPISYSDTDVDPARSECGRERINRLKLGSRQYLARVLSSDAHTLVSLGRNARGDHKVTRLKMDRPSFNALKIAFQDGDARVRIEDQVPAAVPHVVGVSMAGGFLGGQQVHFSRNLNCIIGGRGTGKSTMFEAVRCLTGEPAATSIVDSEVWPNDLTLFWRDQAGRCHTLHRPLGGGLSDLDNPADSQVAFALESYGQGETAEISRRAKDDPIALLSYLDGFVDIAEPTATENRARDELLALEGEIEKAVKNVDTIPQHERTLKSTQQQLIALEQAKAKDVIELQRKLAGEREIRSQVIEKLAAIGQGLDAFSMKATVDELAALAGPGELVVGSQEFERIVDRVRSFERDATTAHSQAKDRFRELQQAAAAEITAWKSKESDAVATIEVKRKALEAQGVQLDLAYIHKLAKDEAKLKKDLGNLRLWQPHLKELRRKKLEVSKARWAARDLVAMTREAYGKEASETLKGVLSDLIVSVKFARNAYSPDAEQQIIQAMGWHTVQVPRASLLIERLGVPGLLTAIDKKDVSAIMAVRLDLQTKLFNKQEAEKLIERLSDPPIRFALERSAVYDLPRLTVTRFVTGPDGKSQPLVRPFAQLSLGQQQSVLLALMLASKSNAPLIIDQPEDNLDGEFIYRTLVPVLRLAKERRQVIVVTHNANIAVLGDAEQIIVLKSTSEKGVIVSRGSIDEPVTRGATCNILEGAREAFAKRAKVYGVTSS